MSAEERPIPALARHATERTPAHAYFVGRREFEAAEVYAVTLRSVERLTSTGRYGEPSLDWRGSEAARMELAHLLISRVSKQRPSRDLQARFLLYVVDRFPDGGFVLDSDELSRWLHVAGDVEHSVRAPAAPQSWISRLRSTFGGSRRRSRDG